MEFTVLDSEKTAQQALQSARQATFEENLTYLHANIGYYLSLDVDLSDERLNEISATIEVLLEQLSITSTC